MKILIIRTFPSVMNIEQYNVQEIGLAKALTLAGYECAIVLYHGFHKSQTEEIAVEGTDRKVTVYWQRGINVLKNGIFMGLKRLIRQYDIIQVHEYDQLTSWKYYSFAKKPVVVYHGPYACDYNKGYNLKCRIFDHTFLKLCKRKKEVLCLTKSPLATKFLQSKGFCNVHTVGVGLDNTVYENAVRGDSESAVSEKCKETGSKKQGIKLLYVGKIEERRNVYFIEEVMRELSQYPQITLTMVGSGEKEYVEKYLGEIEDLLQNGTVTYIPSVKQRDMGKVYREHDILVFPTNYDIFGMVLLEAMYCGVVCVSSLNGGAASVIRNGENGVIIDAFEKKRWVNTILELAFDKERLEEMKKAGKNTIEEQFTWDSIAKKFIEYYKMAGENKDESRCSI